MHAILSILAAIAIFFAVILSGKTLIKLFQFIGDGKPNNYPAYLILTAICWAVFTLLK